MKNIIRHGTCLFLIMFFCVGFDIQGSLLPAARRVTGRAGGIVRTGSTKAAPLFEQIGHQAPATPRKRFGVIPPETSRSGILSPSPRKSFSREDLARIAQESSQEAPPFVPTEPSKESLVVPAESSKFQQDLALLQAQAPEYKKLLEEAQKLLPLTSEQIQKYQQIIATIEAGNITTVKGLELPPQAFEALKQSIAKKIKIKLESLRQHNHSGFDLVEALTLQNPLEWIKEVFKKTKENLQKTGFKIGFIDSQATASRAIIAQPSETEFLKWYSVISLNAKPLAEFVLMPGNSVMYITKAFNNFISPLIKPLEWLSEQSPLNPLTKIENIQQINDADGAQELKNQLKTIENFKQDVEGLQQKLPEYKKLLEEGKKILDLSPEQIQEYEENLRMIEQGSFTGTEAAEHFTELELVQRSPELFTELEQKIEHEKALGAQAKREIETIEKNQADIQELEQEIAQLTESQEKIDALEKEIVNIDAEIKKEEATDKKKAEKLAEDKKNLEQKHQEAKQAYAELKTAQERHAAAIEAQKAQEKILQEDAARKAKLRAEIEELEKKLPISEKALEGEVSKKAKIAEEKEAAEKQFAQDKAEIEANAIQQQKDAEIEKNKKIAIAKQELTKTQAFHNANYAEQQSLIAQLEKNAAQEAAEIINAIRNAEKKKLAEITQSHDKKAAELDAEEAAAIEAQKAEEKIQQENDAQRAKLRAEIEELEKELPINEKALEGEMSKKAKIAQEKEAAEKQFAQDKAEIEANATQQQKNAVIEKNKKIAIAKQELTKTQAFHNANYAEQQSLIAQLEKNAAQEAAEIINAIRNSEKKKLAEITQSHDKKAAELDAEEAAAIEAQKAAELEQAEKARLAEEAAKEEAKKEAQLAEQKRKETEARKLEIEERAAAAKAQLELLQNKEQAIKNETQETQKNVVNIQNKLETIKNQQTEQTQTKEQLEEQLRKAEKLKQELAEKEATLLNAVEDNKKIEADLQNQKTVLAKAEEQRKALSEQIQSMGGKKEAQAPTEVPPTKPTEPSPAKPSAAEEREPHIEAEQKEEAKKEKEHAEKEAPAQEKVEGEGGDGSLPNQPEKKDVEQPLTPAADNVLQQIPQIPKPPVLPESTQQEIPVENLPQPKEETPTTAAEQAKPSEKEKEPIARTTERQYPQPPKPSKAEKPSTGYTPLTGDRFQFMSLPQTPLTGEGPKPAFNPIKPVGTWTTANRPPSRSSTTSSYGGYEQPTYYEQLPMLQPETQPEPTKAQERPTKEQPSPEVIHEELATPIETQLAQRKSSRSSSLLAYLKGVVQWAQAKETQKIAEANLVPKSPAQKKANPIVSFIQNAATAIKSTITELFDLIRSYINK